MVTVSFDPASMLGGLGILAGAVVGFLVLRGLWRALRRAIFRPRLDGLDPRGVQNRWREIEALAAGGEMQAKVAVLEADKLLDHALKALAMSGETLGERLKFAAYKYPRISDVWWAHRLRNQLVHESTFYLEPGMAKKAVAQYKSALRLLNLL